MSLNAMFLPRTTLLGTDSSTPLSQSGPAPRILSGHGNIQPKLRDVCRLFLTLFNDSSFSLLWPCPDFKSSLLGSHAAQQCCRSGSGLDPDSMGSLDRDPDLQSGSGLLIRKKLYKKFLLEFIFFLISCHQIPGSGLEPDPYPEPNSMNPDQQLCFTVTGF